MEGVQGFECLENIVGTLRNEQEVSLSWERESTQQLLDAKRYVKANYKLHVSRDEMCVDHCTVYPLRSRTDPSFKDTCDHAHAIACDTCRGLETIVKETGAKIGSSARC